MEANVKQKTLVFRTAALAAVCAFAVSCGGSFTDPGILDAGGKMDGGANTPRDKFDTAAKEPLRTRSRVLTNPESSRSCPRSLPTWKP